MKRMIHPSHGAHHAMDSHEEARMRTNGWIAEDEVNAPETSAEVEDRAPVKRRLGRPPANKE